MQLVKNDEAFICFPFSCQFEAMLVETWKTTHSIGKLKVLVLFLRSENNWIELRCEILPKFHEKNKINYTSSIWLIFSRLISVIGVTSCL